MNRLVLTLPVIAIIAGCGSGGSTPSKSASPSKLNIGGQVAVYDVAMYLHSCKPRWASANDDVRKGSSVTVYNASGTIVATTTLSADGQSGDSLTSEGCSYNWDASVPASAFYSIQVGSHNKVTTTRAKAVADDASLSFDAN